MQFEEWGHKGSAQMPVNLADKTSTQVEVGGPMLEIAIVNVPVGEAATN